MYIKFSQVCFFQKVNSDLSYKNYSDSFTPIFTVKFSLDLKVNFKLL